LISILINTPIVATPPAFGFNWHLLFGGRGSLNLNPFEDDEVSQWHKLMNEITMGGSYLPMANYYTWISSMEVGGSSLVIMYLN